MSNRIKGFLIAIVGLLIHMNLLVFAKATLQPFATSAMQKATVLPFGKLNYEQVTTLATIEQLLLIILWIVFAVMIFREKK